MKIHMRPSRELCCDQQRSYFLIVPLNNYITNTFKYLFMDDYLFGIAVEYPR